MRRAVRLVFQAARKPCLSRPRKHPPNPAGLRPVLRRGRCLHRPAKPCDAARPLRRAKSPALQSRRERAVTHKRQPSARPAGGPMQASAPTRMGGTPQSSSPYHACRPRLCRPFAIYCRAGVHARRGGLRRPGRVLARQGTAPLSRLAPTAPLTGEPFQTAAPPKASPARSCGVERRLRRRKLFLMQQTAVTPFIIACSAIESIGPPFAHRSGLCRFAATQRSQNASVLQRTQRDAGTANRTVDAPQGADGGVHCRLAAKMSCKARQGFARCFVGDDACIVPQTLRRSKAPRRAKSPALHCGRKWALTCKRQPAARPPLRRGAASQRGELPNAGTPPAVPGRTARPAKLPQAGGGR